MSEPTPTPTRSCPKCRAEMEFEHETGDSVKFSCPACKATFFFDAEDAPVKRLHREARVVLFPDNFKTAAEIIGEHAMKPR